jgi:hypothetical protein
MWPSRRLFRRAVTNSVSLNKLEVTSPNELSQRTALLSGSPPLPLSPTQPTQGEDYTPARLLRRESVKFDTTLLQTMDQLWYLVDTNNDGHLDKTEFRELYVRMVRALGPEIGAKGTTQQKTEEIEKHMEIDWLEDTENGKYDSINRKRFFAAFYRLSDLWTEGIDASSCKVLSNDTM